MNKENKEIAINGSRYKDNIERHMGYYHNHMNKANDNFKVNFESYTIIWKYNPHSLDRLMNDSKNREWVLKEVKDLEFYQIKTYGDIVKYWRNHFCENQYPPSKYEEFIGNFLQILENELTY